MTRSTALVCAVGGAFGYGIGSVLQAAGARRVRRTRQVVAHPLYLAGLVADLVGWLLSLAALRRLPVYQVQATAAGSLAVTVVAARLLWRSPLRRLGGAAVVVTTACLAIIAAGADPRSAPAVTYPVVVGLAAGAVAVGVAALACARRRWPGVHAALAGAAFAVCALCARALPLPPHALDHPPHTVAVLAATPVSWALVVSGAVGTMSYAHALRLGDAGAVTAVLWGVEVVGGATVGFWALGDAVRPGWALPTVLAILGTVAASAVLATAAPAPEPHPQACPQDAPM
ncbi:hypothetical protein [Micromonospora auratinigra]|uniref:Integral membrane protein n=1 Tax=Micromonospora auratinigra TaxID=261654 RepID=A0A1A8Z561_9ACTN|nr:hypothetical protein [Micromonospora auratinigra]SBT38983.1 hypothetical protein GA0070611_0741 [Micromonospora auratinigra]